MCTEVKNCISNDDVVKGIRASLMSKVYGHEEFLARLIAKACSKFILFCTRCLKKNT